MTNLFKLLSVLLALTSGSAGASHYLLTLHKNDNMGSSGSLRCQNMGHCLHLIKGIEHRRPDEACRFIDIRKDGRLVYRKFYQGHSWI